MPRTTRTFVAVEVPKDRTEKLARLQGLLAPEIPDVRWAESTHFHLTLAFLGDVPDADLASVCRAVGEAASEHDPFELVLQGFGAFPDPDRPRTLWVGLVGPALDRLGELRKGVVGALGDVGYPPDDDRFHPHVTLGRLKGGKGPTPDLGPLIRHYAGWVAGAFPIAEVVTYSSRLTPDGPVYTPLSRAPLSGGKLKGRP
jgi:RNA 2',3'-cyclic 3'-phosphodiesterase